MKNIIGHDIIRHDIVLYWALKQKKEATMKEEVIKLKGIKTNIATITIEGDTALILNKMNAQTIRSLMDERKNKPKGTEKPNEWEIKMTSVHWENGWKPTDFTEEGYKDAFANHRPCISAFGLRKSFGDAVVRNNIDKFSTKFFASVNILNELVPVSFAEHVVDEKLMSPKKGAPVLARLNKFTGWSATFDISFVENAYSIDQIIEIITLAGFGLGIGSGRTSGYGRYHVSNITLHG